MNDILAMSTDKALIADRNIRIHYPMPLYNPFKSNERVSPKECFLAYEQWLRNRLIAGDMLITSEMERIAKYVQDDTGQPVRLIGLTGEVEVIKKILMEVLNP